MTPQDHIKLNKAKCLFVSLSVKFKFIELLTQLKMKIQLGKVRKNKMRYINII